MLDLRLLPGEYAICRLPAGTPFPPELDCSGDEVISVTWTPDEVSILCPKGKTPGGCEASTPWRCFRAGPVNLAQTGVLAALVAPLAEARVNIFAFSTHDTDYLLVPTVRLNEARSALTGAGYRVSE